MELNNGISFDHQKLLRYLNGTVIVAFSTIPLAAAALHINIALNLKDLKVLVFAILELKLFALSLERNHKLSDVSE